MKISKYLLTLSLAGVATGCSSPTSGEGPARSADASDTSGGRDVSSAQDASADLADEDALDDVSEADTRADDVVEQDVDPADTTPADTASDDALLDAVEDSSIDAAADAAADVSEDAGPRLPNIGPLDPNDLETVRFILVGDTGEGNAEQYAVSAAAAAHCDERGGCHALILLGDNIYDVGPSSPEDPLLTEYIDLPYANLRYGAPPAEGQEDARERMPILVTLGNHDLGGAGLDTALAAHYIEYGRERDWFYFPSRYWNARIGPVHIAGLDTNPLAYLGTELEEQGAMVDAAVESDARWSLVIGHHPYRSEGKHGNAGSYEGVPGDLVVLGGKFREFVNERICNRVDFYICGHDHNRQWFDESDMIPAFLEFDSEPCTTEFAVSGAGAKTTDFKGRGNDLHFGAETEGFLYMEYTPTGATAHFVSLNGDIEWTETF